MQSFEYLLHALGFDGSQIVGPTSNKTWHHEARQAICQLRGWDTDLLP